MSAAKKASVLLTDRALSDLADIDSYSAQEWGRRTANKYLKEFEAALGRLQENPNLLRAEPDFHPSLAFYRVNKHLLVCDAEGGVIHVLTIIHTSRDIPGRLAELEPSLTAEVELLRKKLHESKKR